MACLASVMTLNYLKKLQGRLPCRNGVRNDVKLAKSCNVDSLAARASAMTLNYLTSCEVDSLAARASAMTLN